MIKNNVIAINIELYLEFLKDNYGLLYETSITDVCAYLDKQRIRYEVWFVPNPKHTGGLVNLFYEDTYTVWEITLKPQEVENAFPAC
jgi:hypothetical protein